MYSMTERKNSLVTKIKSNFNGKQIYKDINKNIGLYILILPTVIYFLVFKYLPMYGIQIAFKDFVASKGILGSEWVGFSHFERFFNSYYFWSLIKNTVGISLYSLIVGFPIPIILALLINEVEDGYFKRIVQTTTYAPHFISTVVMAGMVLSFLSPSSGVLNHIIKLLGGEPIAFMMKPEYFKTIFVLSGVWQNAGWGSIIYLAALSGISKKLHEAASIDGANRLQRIWHINIPGILPTAVILLIMNTGRLMNVGFEKVFLMQNSLNIDSSEVISTFVYKCGLINAQYSFSTAVNLFNAVINFILLFIVNKVSKRLTNTSLW